MMVRTSTANLVGNALSNLMRAQARQAEAAQQVGSEKRATDHSGYGRGAEQLTALKSTFARTESFAAAGQAAADRLGAQNLHLEELAEAALGARQAIATALATGRADAMMAELQSRFSAAASALNGTWQGEYIFAGTTSDVKPVTASTLEELAPGGVIIDVFANNDRRVTTQVDESTTLPVGFLANDMAQGLFDAIGRIQSHNVTSGQPFVGRLTPAQTAVLEAELAALDTAHQFIISKVAENGGLQAQAETATQATRDRATHLEGLFIDKTGVNMAEAVTRLQLSQTAVQASAQVLATLKQSSLLELLR